LVTLTALFRGVRRRGRGRGRPAEAAGGLLAQGSSKLGGRLAGNTGEGSNCEQGKKAGTK